MTGSIPGRGGLVVAQPGAGGGLVEDLHDLGAEAPGELADAAEGVLSRDPALLVRGGAERQVGLAEQPVMGDHAVARGEHVGQVGPHAPVHRDRAPGPERGPGAGGEAGVGADADDDQNHAGLPGHRRAISCGGLDLEPSRFATGAGLICRTVVPVRTSTPRPASWPWTRAPRAGSTVGSTSGSLFHLDDVQAAGGGVQPQAHPGGFQVRGGAVGQVAPVRHFPGDVVGDAADREVRVGVRDDHADVGAGVELAGPQRGAYPGVAAADRDQVHDWILQVGAQ